MYVRKEECPERIRKGNGKREFYMTKKLVYSGIGAALVCVLTLFPQIPLAFGYMNLGDALIIILSYLLGWWAVPAAAIGSTLADLFMYPAYAPVTLVIKGCMAAVMAALFSLTGENPEKKLKAVCFIAPVLSEAIMTTGYFLYEWALFGLAPATANLIYSLLQAAASLVLGFLLLAIFIKRDLRKKIFSGKKHE